jgi:hypothetical protein
MNEQRIREIAEQSSYHAENSVDYYSGIVDGLTWEAKILKARDLKFAELIVRECMRKTAGYLLEDEFGGSDVKEASEELAKHFGVE